MPDRVDCGTGGCALDDRLAFKLAKSVVITSCSPQTHTRGGCVRLTSMLIHVTISINVFIQIFDQIRIQADVDDSPLPQS